MHATQRNDLRERLQCSRQRVQQLPGWSDELLKRVSDNLDRCRQLWSMRKRVPVPTADGLRIGRLREFAMRSCLQRSLPQVHVAPVLQQEVLGL
jgi:hypothetical protein